MEYLVCAQEMRQFDHNTSEYFKVPSIVLMERAALACLEVICERQKRLGEALAGMGETPGNRVLVVAGCGNNGGDGLALGRLLRQANFCVDVVLVGSREKLTPACRQQLESLQAYGQKILDILPDKEYDIIVDALFGVGLTRSLTGFCRECVEYINGRDAFVLSVDIPSGIHADTGAVMGAAVYADVTVTFGFVKLGAFLYPGARYAGQVRCFPIGITADSFLGETPGRFTFTEPVDSLMPVRRPDGNKGSFGKAAILAGSETMAGAAILAGEGAFAAGCGMVKLISPVENRSVLQCALPEAMVTQDIREACGWADVIAAGPGLGRMRTAVEQLHYIIEETRKPLILDADAINLLAQEPALLAMLCDMQKDSAKRRPLALTPHPGELARMAGISVQEVLADVEGLLKLWAQKLSAVILCKGARTYVVCPEGRIYINGSGNSGMATAGSGDVLTGITAALTAQDEDLFHAVCIGVYLHGLAGDRAAHKKGEYSMKAGDIAEAVPGLIG